MMRERYRKNLKLSLSNCAGKHAKKRRRDGIRGESLGWRTNAIRYKDVHALLVFYSRTRRTIHGAHSVLHNSVTARRDVMNCWNRVVPRITVARASAAASCSYTIHSCASLSNSRSVAECPGCMQRIPIPDVPVHACSPCSRWYVRSRFSFERGLIARPTDTTP